MKPLVLVPRRLASLALPLVVALAAPVVSAASSSSASMSGTSPATSADPAAAASAPAQRTKMKTCNADAKGKHGDERKAFMTQCLSKKGAASAAS